MTVKTLRIAGGLRLPIDVAGEAIAILAKRGAGKTNTATVLVEELVGAGVQTVILDPVGAWWGIRANDAGDPKGGLKVPILGGQHGDVPLEPAAGALIADVAVDTGQSLLLDLSDFPSKASTERFVLDFADRLFRRKARQPSLVHLVLEEADTFAPQSPKGGFRGDAGKMAAAVEQIVRRGRARGIGITMVTQRSAVLNKDVLSQADVLVAMRTTSPHDVTAIKLWVAAHGDDEQGVVASLPSLATGEAWFWNPERDLLSRVHVRRRRTFDSSATPKAGERRAQPSELATIDLEALGAEIAKTAEQAKANDPAELRKQIRSLERELAQRPTEEQVVEVERIVERPVLNGEVEELGHAVAAMRELAGNLAAVGERISASADTIAGAVATVGAGRTERATTAARRPVASGTGEAVRRAPARRPAPTAAAREPADGVSAPQQKILDALAWLQVTLGRRSASRIQVAFLSGYKVAGHFNNLVGGLRTAGLVDYPRDKHIGLTEAGRAVAAEPGPPLSPEELQAAVMGKLKGPQQKILQTLLDAYHDEGALTREELASRTGYEVAGHFNNLVGSLRSLELVSYPEKGWVAAEPVLFLEDA